jgi:hypothetical protein
MRRLKRVEPGVVRTQNSRPRSAYAKTALADAALEPVERRVVRPTATARAAGKIRGAIRARGMRFGKRGAPRIVLRTEQAIH